jgi:transketolase
MAALMKLRSISVYTHDSIGLGEDGPTHQSVEHASSLRLIPNLDVWRPCDTVESALAWIAAIERENGPSCLLFTRQNVPFNARDREQIEAIRRGGYVLRDAADAKAVILATGPRCRWRSVREGARGCRNRAWYRCHARMCRSADAAWRESALPRGIPRVASGGHRLLARVGAVDDPHGAVVGIDRFGESAPGGVLFKHFGFTIENVVATVKNVL